MSEHDINEWETGSGLSLAGADAEIIGATFGFNDKIGAGVICANFTFQPTEGGDPVEQSFSVGNGWEIAEKGDLLVTADGRPRKINSNTNFGRLIDSITGAGMFADRGPACKGEVPFDTPRRASNWIGTMWTVDTVQVKTTNPSTKVEGVKDAYVFTDYLGRSDDAPTKGKAGGKPAGRPAASAGRGAAKPKAGPDDDFGIEDDDLRAALVELAATSDDHASFVEAAYDIDGVEGDGAVEKAIYNKKPGSLWATANA